MIDHGKANTRCSRTCRWQRSRRERRDRLTRHAGRGVRQQRQLLGAPSAHQLQTGPDLFASRSLSAPIRDYLADGEPVEIGEPHRGQTVPSAPE